MDWRGFAGEMIPNSIFLFEIRSILMSELPLNDIHIILGFLIHFEK